MEKYVAYVGTYTHENSVGIYVYDINVEEGILTERSVAPINNPSYLTVSKDGKFLYSIADEGVASFTIDENGDLTKINQSWIGGMRGCYVETDSKHRYLFVGGYHDGRVTMMHLNDDGSIGEIADGIFHQGGFLSQNEKRLDHPKVTCVTLTPDEQYLCAVDFGLNQTKIYEIDYENGKLRLVDIIRSSLDAGARILRFSRDGRFAYIMTGEANTIEVYTYNNDNGPSFERIQKVEAVDNPTDNAGCTNCYFSSDDSYLFVSVDAMNGFSFLKRDAETGKLSWCGFTTSSGDYPKSLAVLPGDQLVAVLNHDTNDIRTFKMHYDENFALHKNKPVKVYKPNCIRIHKIVTEG